MKPLDFQAISERMLEREHQLIKITDVERPMKGNLIGKCKCGCTFEVNARSYMSSKNGCPTCKKKAISLNNKNRVKNSSPSTIVSLDNKTENSSYVKTRNNLTANDIKLLVTSRKQELINLTYTELVYKGVLEIKCHCGHQFKQTVCGYLVSKIGCPICTKLATKLRKKTVVDKLIESHTNEGLGENNLIQNNPVVKNPLNLIKNNTDGSYNNTWFKTLNRNNSYFQFLKQLPPRLKHKKTTPSSERVQKHHILPKHWFGSSKEELAFIESPENIVYLLLKDHIKAHKLLFELYGSVGDLGGLKLLEGDKAAARLLWQRQGAIATHSLLKKEGRNFWNKETQLEFQLKNSQDRTIIATDRFKCSFEGTEVLCLMNCRTNNDVIVQLNTFTRQLQAYRKIIKQMTGTEIKEIKKASVLINGSRLTHYGWSFKKYTN